MLCFRESSRPAPTVNLWFITCLLRAYCTRCYLFEAICTEIVLFPSLRFRLNVKYFFFFFELSVNDGRTNSVAINGTRRHKRASFNHVQGHKQTPAPQIQRYDDLLPKYSVQSWFIPELVLV